MPNKILTLGISHFLQVWILKCSNLGVLSAEQDGLRVSSVNASPNSARSSEFSSKLNGYDPNETIKSLNEKLSAALLSINSKEELVRQHVKVAEEAVAGWEKAEADVAALKKQVEVVSQKNYALEDRIKQLDAALKECVRQLRQSREEQEQNFRETLSKKTKEWEDEKFELETQIVELQAKLKVKAETASSIDHQLCLKLEALEKEKSSLQIERDLSTQAAETASKQHLKSIKKLAKLEAECHRLRAGTRKPIASSVCVESLADSQSDSGERLIALDNEPSCSDSWASALIVELDQFKNGKATKRNLTASATEIDLMDDFLEMERLAALPEAGHESSSLHTDSDSRMEVEVMRGQLAELKQKIGRIEAEKVKMEMSLSEKLEAKFKEMESAEAERKDLEFQVKMAQSEIRKMQMRFSLLEKEIDDERKLSSEYITRCQDMEIINTKSREIENQLISAIRETDELNIKIHTLEGNLKEEEALSAKLASKVEDVEANRKTLSSQLESADVESSKLKEKIRLLEEEAEQERAHSVELAAKCQHLRSQLNSADFEVGQLHEKVRSVERIIDEERASLTEFKAQEEAIMEEKKIEVEELHKKAELLERKGEEERVISAGLAASRVELEAQLESAHLEVQRLQDIASSLRQDVDEEKSMSAEPPIKKQEDDLIMLRKEKDFVMASSEMYVACQKTINSISQQLKSLSNFENLMLESEGCGPSSSSSS